MITYHQLRTFLVVARAGNVTRAARELNATQPTVSQQLRALRESLGTPLIERGGGGLRLTPAGEKLRRYAEDTLGGLRTVRQEIAALKGTLAGPLAVGVNFVLSGQILLPVLSRFRAQFPNVDLQVRVGLPEALFAALLGNTLDVICYLRVATPPGLTVEPVAHEEFVAIASPEHPLAGRRRITPQELSEHPFVVMTPRPLRKVLESKLREAGVVPRAVVETGNYDAVTRLVERNAGYSIHLRALVAAELASGRLVALDLDAPPIFGEIVAAFVTRPLVSPLVREFVRSLRAELAGAAASEATTPPA